MCNDCNQSFVYQSKLKQHRNSISVRGSITVFMVDVIENINTHKTSTIIWQPINKNHMSVTYVIKLLMKRGF